ncbi:MAG TPA: HIT domain-containing protein [Acidimicrobiales bacterium]
MTDSRLDRLWAGWRNAFVTGAAGDTTEGCVFCALLASGLPDPETHILWRHPDGLAFAILNAYPYTSGHLMVMPTRHVGELELLGGDESAAVWSGLAAAVQAIKAAYHPDGLNLGANLGRVAGAGVPSHFHMHVLPRWMGDTNFMTAVADTRVLPEALSDSDTKLRAAWPAAGAWP